MGELLRNKYNPREFVYKSETVAAFLDSLVPMYAAEYVLHMGPPVQESGAATAPARPAEKMRVPRKRAQAAAIKERTLDEAQVVEVPLKSVKLEHGFFECYMSNHLQVWVSVLTP